MSAKKVSKKQNTPDVNDLFCFICGTKLTEIGLGYLQCKSEQCGEVYLPFMDEDNNQYLMKQKTIKIR